MTSRRDELVALARERGQWDVFRERAGLRSARWASAAARGALPGDGAVAAALDAFRRARGLLAADDAEAWLDRWGLEFEEWAAWVAAGIMTDRVDGPAPAGERDTLVEAVCSGALERLAGPRRTSRRPPPGASLDCGPEALAAVCRRHGLALDAEGARSLAGGPAATSLLDLVRAAQGLGLTATAIKASRQRLGELPLPAIAHVDGFHWVVVEAVGDGWVDVLDGGTRRRLAREGFAERWTGYAALIGPAEAGRP